MAGEIIVIGRRIIMQQREEADRSSVEFDVLFLYDLGEGIKDFNGVVVKLTLSSELPARALAQNWVPASAITRLNDGRGAFEVETLLFGPGTTHAQMLVVAQARYAVTKTEFIARTTDDLQLAGRASDAT